MTQFGERTYFFRRPEALWFFPAESAVRMPRAAASPFRAWRLSFRVWWIP